MKIISFFTTISTALLLAVPGSIAAERSPVTGATPRLELPGTEHFEIEGRAAFLVLPSAEKRSTPQPWIFYAPTLPGYPDGAEKWMHQSFLEAGIAVAGIDVGEAYGSPGSHAHFDALYRELVEKRKFAPKPVLFGRSRGGLWVSSWAIANPTRVAGIVGIYPVFDFRSYPGIEKAAASYGLPPEELAAKPDLNPIHRIDVLARARIPIALIHGDIDKVVPLEPNSGAVLEAYRKAGADSQIKLIILRGQGHNFYEGFFHSQALVDHAIKYARSGVGKAVKRSE